MPVRGKAHKYEHPAIFRIDRIVSCRKTGEKFKISYANRFEEAEVYGKGILMWLLSQGSRVEVLKPESLREEMRQTLEEMLRKYSAKANPYART